MILVVVRLYCTLDSAELLHRFLHTHLDMASQKMAQDIMLCDMCETSPVQMHCNSCAVNLCNGCVSDHISADTEKDHHVVIFKKKNTKPIFPRCKTHEDQNCEMKCQNCEIPLCVKCLASGSHRTHHLTDLLEICNSQKETIRQKTAALEKSIYPKYEKVIAELEDQIKKVPQTFAKMTSDVSKQGEVWHREVDVIINRQKQEIEKMKTDNLATLKKLLDEMKNLLSTLRQAIVDNKELLQSTNVTKVLDSKYISPEMWDPPPSIGVTPPTFTPLPIQREQLHQMFGTLTAASMPRSLSSIKLVEDKLATAVKQLQLLDSPKSPSSLHTAYQRGLYSITCLSPDQVWVSGDCDSKISRFTVTGSLQETVTTTTGNMPYGITVTRQGDLIYTDYRDRSINRVRHRKIEKIISLQQDWRPGRVCCTDSDDLLVTMQKSSTPSRVVRYSGSTEKQIIQSDDQGKPLFSNYSYMFIAENSNKDMICVSDCAAHTVVVLNQAGKLRFRYTGNLSSQKYKSFSPRGMVIDSMGHILVADYNNHCIHIIDQQGHFIQYIDNCRLSKSYDLSLDRNINTLYVAENNTDKVKVIKYLT